MILSWQIPCPKSEEVYLFRQIGTALLATPRSKSGFSNSLSITWPWIVRIIIFDPLSFVRTGSKLSFRTVYQSRENELFENSFLIHFRLVELDQKWVFDQFESGSKVGFRHVIINFEEKLGWIKIESACICFTWLTSFTYFTGSKFGPPRICCI